MSQTKPSHVDVLIVGGGPSGLMTATWLANLDISCRIIDKRGTRALAGRGDGLMSRTLEIMHSFKLGDAMHEVGWPLYEQVVWAQDGKGNLNFMERNPTWGFETCFVSPSCAHQGHIEAIFLDGLKRARKPVEVERAVQPIDMNIDAAAAEKGDRDAYPVTVTVKHLSEAEADIWTSNAHTILPDGSIRDEPSTKVCPVVADGAYQTEFQQSDQAGKIETIHAKYVLGAEGAHSWVRRKIGIEMEGSATDTVWGVIDVIPITDFPDFRRQATIITSKHDPLINVPRENGLSRLYIPLPHDYAEGSSREALVDPSRAVCKKFMEIARGALHPYTLDYQYCDWYTLYKVGQRVASSYSDPTHRVFIAGDACHTHTPKGGQGMNVSMQDAYNLGWKLAGVLKGQLNPEVLASYETERRPIGRTLVEIDDILVKGLGGAAGDAQKMREAFGYLRKFSDGRAVIYESSKTVAEEIKDRTGAGLTLGTRIPNIQVRSQSSSVKKTMMDLLPSNGQWRLVVYGGDVSKSSQLERVNRVGAAVGGPKGLVNRYPSLTPHKPWLDVLLVHAAPILSVNTQVFHEAFRPAYGEHANTLMSQIWADAPGLIEEKNGQPGESHHTLGIDPAVGVMALVRPDTFVGWVGNFEDTGSLEKFCAGVFKGTGLVNGSA